jgi:hypothetical protein
VIGGVETLGREAEEMQMDAGGGHGAVLSSGSAGG